MKNHIESYSISPKAKRYLSDFMAENPEIKAMMDSSATYEDFLMRMRQMTEQLIGERPAVQRYLLRKKTTESIRDLAWSDYALIRLHHYLQYEGQVFEDFNVKSHTVVSQPFKLLWLSWKDGTGGAKSDFIIDTIELFRQLKSKKTKRRISRETLTEWMNRHPSGLEEDIIAIRRQNKRRIIETFIRLYEGNKINKSQKYSLPGSLTREEKIARVEAWWNDPAFHLRYAIRDYKMLDEYLDHSLTDKKMALFKKATRKGLPFFVNLYYLSLINTGKSGEYIGADMPIRDYIFYNDDLIEAFGKITAWEKEDVVEAGKPNAAGWILPNDHNIHRRYPEVAIFIPDSMGRSCGGLCVSCQRMYDFQKGHLNFNLKKLAPRKSWDQRMKELLGYFESDSQLRDILITGGDALMSSNKTLRKILDEVYAMALRKTEANQHRPQGGKYAVMRRIRLGTRLPVYLPQRIDDELVEILSSFKKKAEKIGFRQFIIQTHFVTAMEITPESRAAIEKLLSAGWRVTNQAVFTTAVARRGHLAKLRRELSKIGVLPYYTFSVKGFRENRYNFATNARLAQEAAEEKHFGLLNEEEQKTVSNAGDIRKALSKIMQERDLPFIATDRSVMNLPAVGKSLSFAVAGITHDGRRILRFNHDQKRHHSPKVNMQSDVFIVESKSIQKLIEQLGKKGDRQEDYQSLFGYSLSVTEQRASFYEYPAEEESITGEFTHYSADE